LIIALCRLIAAICKLSHRPKSQEPVMSIFLYYPAISSQT
jgi:hypothetical protein